MYTNEQFRQAVKNSNNIRQVCKALQIAPYGSNYEVIKNKIKQLNLDISHFGTKPLNIPKKYSFKLSEILMKGSYYTNVTSLKKRLIAEKFFEEKCSNCNKSTYDINGKIISMPLQLHHIDGDRHNNELNNLTLLCPICHYLTKNFRGKNKKNINYIVCQSCGKKIKKNKYGLCRSCYVEKKSVNKNSIKKCLNCGKQLSKSKSGYCRSCINKLLTNKNKPSKKILEQEIKDQSFSFLGKKYGVSDNTIKNWCIKYDIDLSYATGGRKKIYSRFKKRS